MSRVIVYRFPRDGVDDKELLTLLKDAECELIDAQEDDEFEEPMICLLVVLTDAVLQDGRLEKRLEKAVRQGRNIIAIWPSGSTGDSWPPSLRKYGNSQITWSAAKLRQALRQIEKPRFEMADGRPLPKEDLKRNCAK